jgi:hypothetical protein
LGCAADRASDKPLVLLILFGLRGNPSLFANKIFVSQRGDDEQVPR